MRIAIGSDEAGYPLKEILRTYLEGPTAIPVDVVDFGVHDLDPTDYPDIGFSVSEAVARGEFDRAILICGTGIGMSIVANKVAGVRAALCHDVYSAERARKSNDAQVITLGARVIGPEAAKRIIEAWLPCEFERGRSAPKVRKIIDYERSRPRGVRAGRRAATV